MYALLCTSVVLNATVDPQSDTVGHTYGIRFHPPSLMSVLPRTGTTYSPVLV